MGALCDSTVEREPGKALWRQLETSSVSAATFLVAVAGCTRTRRLYCRPESLISTRVGQISHESKAPFSSDDTSGTTTVTTDLVNNFHQLISQGQLEYWKEESSRVLY